MGPELYKVTINAILEIVKIIGPAIITAIVGFKAGQVQVKQKMEELKKQNEFKAREKIFEYKKEKLVNLDKSISELNSTLGQFAGMTLADYSDEMKLQSFVERYLKSHIDGLPFQLNNVLLELRRFSTEFSEEILLMERYLNEPKDLKSANNAEEIQATIVHLIEVYGRCNHCLRSVVEKEAMAIFKPYTNA